MKVFISALLLGLVFTGQTLKAVEIERLYEAEVIAKSEFRHDREVAVKTALEIVLTRILAGKEILKDNTVKNVLANAKDYVVEFQYALVPAIDQTDSHTRLIRVLFNEQLLMKVLRPSKLDYWNEIRTKTLVWLVVEEAGKQRIFEPGLMPEVDAAMAKAAKLKGLPIIYPIQDLNEKKNLTISDVLSAYSDHLLAVSQRYDVVSTVAAKLVNMGSCWKAEWTLYFDAKIEQWRSPCGLINAVALNGFQGVYDRLSSYYAVKSEITEIESVNIKVSQIDDLTEKEWVSDYLDSLPMVKTVTWVYEDSGSNLYRVFYQGERQVLIDALVNDDVLRADNLSQLHTEVMKYQLLSE